MTFINIIIRVMECIICKDKGSEPLQENRNCSCKYMYHSSCWIDYAHSKKNKITCPLCRIDLTVKKPSRNNPNTHTIQEWTESPYYSNTHSNSQQVGQPITYDEFVENINSYQQTTTINTTQSQSDSPPSNTSSTRTIIKKIFRVIGALFFIVAIVLVTISFF